MSCTSFAADFALKFTEIQVCCPGMKRAGCHKEAGDMKKRQQIQMHIAGSKAQVITEMDVGKQNIAMTEQGPPGRPATAAVWIM